MKNKIISYLKFTKNIAPDIFENATPKFHIDILEFVLSSGLRKACAVFRGAGKSTLLNKILVLCRVFFAHEPFIMIVSNDKEKASSFLRDIKEMVVKASQKGYALSQGQIWTQDRCEIVVNKGLKDKKGNNIETTCFIVAMGAGQDPRGYTYKFRRPTLIIADDLESKVGQYAINNIRNRQKLREWFFADLIPALHPTIGKIVIIGTILSEDSLLNNIILSKNKDDTNEWQTKIIPIIENDKSIWQSRFSLEKIKNIKASFDNIGLNSEFYQEYMCRAISPEKQLFKREHLRYFKRVEYNKSKPPISFEVHDAITRTRIVAPEAERIIINDDTELNLKDCSVFSTMDLATFNGHDKTAIITFAVQGYNIYVLDIQCGRWTPFEKGVKVIETHLKFRPRRFGIEKAGAQNDFFYTIDVMQTQTGVKIPVEPLSHHSKSKNVRISQLHPYFVAGRVFLNESIENTKELEAQILTFDPEVDSKFDDVIDALAYILEFIVGRFYSRDEASEDEIYDEDMDNGWA
ncbi:hypothetical protein CFT12S00416_05425 [Campylobacter fetus subsp. testudinum]|uniref:phage terminase large subunit n=1 Tax=Campylobacter fetus TaxID=196 RepID=UPI000818A167|nr:phage terminase large subunit [Campylobacter fetus]OCR88866.1 hypothetical protein CFT12S00416_05425 [Campylobacter fetus subsp. testudinum]